MTEHKKKQIGFRVAMPQYISIIQSADALGISITDYLITKVFPEKTPTHETSYAKQPVILIADKKDLDKNNSSLVQETSDSKQVIVSAEVKKDIIDNNSLPNSAKKNSSENNSIKKLFPDEYESLLTQLNNQDHE